MAVKTKSDQRDILISMMLNSLHFNIFTFFILKEGNLYRLYEGLPRDLRQVGSKCFQSLNDARNTANKIVKPKAVFKNKEESPHWGPFYTPDDAWLNQKLNIETNSERKRDR